jgi:hypothetical protein
MIYVLTKETNPLDPKWENLSNIFQYVNLEYVVQDFLFTDQKTIINKIEKNSTLTIDEIDNIIKDNLIETKIFICNLHVSDNSYSLAIHSKIFAEKYKEIFFIFYYEETDVLLYSNFLENVPDNIIYIVNSFGINNKNINKIFPYYFVNSYLQKYYKSMWAIFNGNEGLRKVKKYNFFNGVHKPHRFVAYDLIKQNELLDEGFFSYLDYPKYLQNDLHIKSLSNWYEMNYDEFKLFLNDFEIPYLNDCYDKNPSQPGNFYAPFLHPPIYSWQSYVCITSETNYFESGDVVSLSEKSFKPFAGFNIPLIYGQPYLVEYLRSRGFDMFDDLFDNTPVFGKHDMINQLNRNLSVIKNMSMEDFHWYYLENFRRIEHNFNRLLEMKGMDFYNINNIMNNYFDEKK